MSLDQQQQTMRAINVHKFGGPEVLALETVEMPEPQADEILVRIKATSVNPVDYKARQGKFPPVGEDQLPWIPGRDFCGVVEFVTPSSMFAVGDRVYGMPTFDRGTYAEFIAVRATEVAPAPASIEDDAIAAAIPLAALTAWQGLFEHGGLQAGQRVLIHAGAGGVGHLAVQFAKNKGAYVIATASNRDLDFVRELGADQAVDYQAERFEDVAKDMDVVLDLIGGETQERSFATLKEGGILASALAEPPKETLERLKIRGVRYMSHPSAHELAEIASLIDHGKVSVTVFETFPLDRIADAHKRAEQGGFRGKIAVRI